ncbi:hypothetical protein F4803DRAFT_568563 [Xylaria telfairii]|nr:hypothetical protein F4803DRAFT_568563 [Xylaria telfairii]
MAEALGLAASVAGIVALGIEVCKGIGNYVTAARGRKEELEVIHRQSKTFQDHVETLKNLSASIPSQHQAAGNTVLAALKSGELELQALKALVEELGGPSSQSQSMNSIVKYKWKTAYPLHRNRLVTLQQRLDRTNMSLDAAIGALCLVIVLSIDQSSTNALSQLSALRDIATANNSISLSIKMIIDTFIPRIGQDLTEINNSLKANPPIIRQDLTSMSETIIETLTRKIEKVHDELGAMPGPNLALFSELFGGANRATAILNNLSETKESDPPQLLRATAEQRVLYRLIQSPARLEEVCTFYRENDKVEHEFTIEQQDAPALEPEKTNCNIFTNSHISTCICRPKHESVRRYARLRDLSFHTLSVSRRKHLPECIYAKSEVISKSNSVGLSYRGLRWLLSRAVDVSISFTTGAGGLSISPNITLRLVVDELQAPVFRCLRLMQAASYRTSFDKRYITYRWIEVAMDRIFRQYICRKSSPYEVNCKGETAFHLWVKVLAFYSSWPDEFGDPLITITKRLLEAGLPAFLCNDKGASAGAWLLKYRSDSIVGFRGLIPLLYEEAPEPSFYHQYSLTGTFRTDWFAISSRLHSIPDVSEILGCGPLSATVILGNEAKVKDLVTAHRSTLHENNLAHQTPFHFATDKPRILQLLLGAASSQKLNCPDEEGDYALDYALRRTSTICANGNSWIACSGCPCIECVEILLGFHWCCRFDFLRYCDSMSHTARLRMIDHLVSRRAELKAQGRNNLSSIEISDQNLKDRSILDSNAYRGAELLFPPGVSVSPLVGTTWRPPYIRYQGSVYHNEDAFLTDSCNRLAKLLYDKGFHDIDQVDTAGYSPLAKLVDVGVRGDKSRPSYAMWLIDHGADLMRPYPIRSFFQPWKYGLNTFKIAHVILLCLPCDEFDEFRASEIKSYHQLVSLVAPMDQPDECCCECVGTGCHTMKSLFEKIWEKSTDRWRISEIQAPIKSSSIPKTAGKISSFLRGLALDLSKWDRLPMLALRYFTFEVLDLHHTCCRMLYEGCGLSKDDIADIEDDNREQIDLLKRLLQEFQVSFRNYDYQDSQGDKFTSFLTTEWSARMQEILADLEVVPLTAENRQQAEDIGVRWQPAWKDKEQEDTKDIKYWLKWLDEVMPDE